MSSTSTLKNIAFRLLSVRRKLYLLSTMAGLLRYGVARVSITSCFARPSAVSRKQQPKARCSASPSNSANSGAPGGADWAYPGREGWTLGTRAPPKASLTDGSGKPINNTLSGVTLKYVEVIHWLFLLPPVFLSYVAYTSLGSSLQSFFIVAYPIIQVCGNNIVCVISKK